MHYIKLVLILCLLEMIGKDQRYFLELEKKFQKHGVEIFTFHTQKIFLQRA